MSNLSYNEKYTIMRNRVIFADYIARKELNKEGNPLALNMSPPNNEASIITAIRYGATFTTAAELASYLNETPVDTSTVPGSPLSLCVIPSDSALTIIFLAGSNGGSPITNYQYSTDGTTFTALSPAQTTSPLTISGLTNGSTYTIYLKAVNSIGTSVASSAITAAPIPNTFSPASITGLNVWLDAQQVAKVILTNDQVSGWNDSSSAINNFTASATGIINYSQPGINGRPALNFTTSHPTSTYLTKTMNITPSDQLSLFMILSQTNPGNTNSELFYTRNGFVNFDLFNNTNPGQTGNLSLNARSTTQQNTGVDIITTPASISIISVALNTTVGSIYVNGSSTSVANTSFTGTNLNAAFDWTISGGDFKGYIGEVITYPSVLSDTDRQKIEGYLAWKWGLQASLPAGHPYKSAPPSA